MAIKIYHPVRHKGKFFAAGTVIPDADMDAKSQARLVEKRVAEYVDSGGKPKTRRKADA